MPTRYDPPTTVWGALLIAADLLEKAGLARLETIRRDYDAGKLSVFAALQDALWGSYDKVPNIDSGIPRICADDPRCAMYWEAIRGLNQFCGGTDDMWPVDAIDAHTEPPEATAASVADLMRRAASQTRPETRPARPAGNRVNIRVP